MPTNLHADTVTKVSLLPLLYIKMDSKPLIVVQSVKPVPTYKAHKILKKFLQNETAANNSSLSMTKREQQSALPDDVVNKLTIILAELDENEDGTAQDFMSPSGKMEDGVGGDLNASTNKKKKRSKDKEQESAGKSVKKQKKDKNDSVSTQLILNQNTNTNEVVDVAAQNKLMSMKKAVKKIAAQ
jgi:hypothetical protein